MRKMIFGATALTFFCLIFGQAARAQSPELTVGFYNVENLFDLEDDPNTRDDDFMPDGRQQWTRKRYEDKLGKLGKVIGELGGGPDLLGLCEVENAFVVKELLKNDAIKGRKYQFVHEESPDERGIDVAFVYDPKKFKVLEHQAIRIKLPIEGDSTTRDALMVKGEAEGKTLYCFVNHWPSRRNPDETRKFVARRLRSVVDSLLALDPEANLVFIGDFNDTPGDPSLNVLETGQAEIAAENSRLPASSGRLYNLMTAMERDGIGTHQYRMEWNILDQAILSPALISGANGIKYIQGSATIFKPEWLQEQKNEKYRGSPYRTYVGSKYLGGYSDHFPIFFHLSLN